MVELDLISKMSCLEYKHAHRQIGSIKEVKQLENQLAPRAPPVWSSKWVRAHGPKAASGISREHSKCRLACSAQETDNGDECHLVCAETAPKHEKNRQFDWDFWERESLISLTISWVLLIFQFCATVWDLPAQAVRRIWITVSRFLNTKWFQMKWGMKHWKRKPVRVWRLYTRRY